MIFESKHERYFLYYVLYKLHNTYIYYYYNIVQIFKATAFGNLFIFVCITK